MPKFTDERVAAALRGPRTFRTIDFPGTSEVKVAVRCLSEAEIDAARLEAQGKLRRECSAKGWDPVASTDMDPDLLRRYTERELVFAAYYDHETVTSGKPERFFPTTGDLASLDATTVSRLFEAYTDHQLWVSPMLTLGDAELKELVTALGNESSASVGLQGFDRSTLARCVISLASRLRSTT